MQHANDIARAIAAAIASCTHDDAVAQKAAAAAAESLYPRNKERRSWAVKNIGVFFDTERETMRIMGKAAQTPP